jgi:alkylation response protein AidB-like acyl-CoA dehydrogenase
MNDCLSQVVEYSKKLYQHGSHLANKQLIQRHIAKIAISIETTKWVTYRAAIAKQKLNDYIESLKQHDENDNEIK